MVWQEAYLTGGTGYVPSHTIHQLLEQGYKVRTSIRSLSKERELRACFEGLVGKELVDSTLEVFAADLVSDTNWKENFKGVEYVLHLASPFILAEPENPDDLIIPATEGTLKILRLSSDEPSVKQVVLTSSFVTIGYGHGPERTEPFTEQDWSRLDGPGVNTYVKSKTLAERAAWDFVKENKPHFHITVIAPSVVFGPLLPNSTASSTSIGLIDKIISGGSKDGAPVNSFVIVDVRDVAKIHIASIGNQKSYGERFLLCGSNTYSFLDVANILRKAVQEELQKDIPVKELEGPKVSKRMDNRIVIAVFNWKPICSDEETFISTAQSILANHSS
ncbi:cinnamyl-alcohol dehydrogenase [Scheffersomyces xylosifermentans]|uniref:cinnamyl-alcohol dehydrogenase n=1 Tax=Scheffersomyces xylosifermentans TaxID=1304137 RepID=UPI00315D2EBD